jgi:hypothetical protein
MSILLLRRPLALLSLAAACHSSPGPGGPPIASRVEAPPASNRAIITNAEIPTTGTESAYDLIQRVRPEYLRTKPTQTYMGASSNAAPPPALFLNGQHIGELADLRSVPAPALSMIRYYNIEEGKRKYGMQYGGGVIEIQYRTP